MHQTSVAWIAAAWLICVGLIVGGGLLALIPNRTVNTSAWLALTNIRHPIQVPDPNPTETELKIKQSRAVVAMTDDKLTEYQNRVMTALLIPTFAAIIAVIYLKWMA
jgi:hypothetical protein